MASFLIQLQASGMQFHKKETPVQVLSSEFWEIFKNTFLTEHLQTTASELNLYQEVIKIV